MLIRKFPEFTNFCPYIRTEQTILELLERDRDMISDEFELMVIPLAHLINIIGERNTNAFLSGLETKPGTLRVFICQHILVDRLMFRPEDIVFTPHATVNGRYYTIPHYTVNSDTSKMEDTRNTLFSFVGSVRTHHTRSELVRLYPNCCFDSGHHWGLDLNVEEYIRTRYVTMLGESEYSLCPRGTGISSVRLFESMSMGSFPVIIADGYQPPMSRVIDWSKISLTVAEDDLSSIPDILKEISLDRGLLQKTYSEHFSNDRLHSSVIYELNNLK